MFIVGKIVKRIGNSPVITDEQKKNEDIFRNINFITLFLQSGIKLSYYCNLILTLFST